MPEAIKASEQNLDKVFCNDYMFEIPYYQRPYAWTTEEVGELLDDLLFAMDKDAEAPYFLGSIVLIKGDSPDSKVIDGQQRLTTLTILLCTMRELAENRESAGGPGWAHPAETRRSGRHTGSGPAASPAARPGLLSRQCAG